MCFSNNAIEQRALEMTEQIQKKSIYKLVRTGFIGGEILELHEQSSIRNGFNHTFGKDVPLITEVILEGSDGRHYNIEPNHNGLRFAEGEITYKEYEKLQRKENMQGLGLLSITISIYLLVGGTLISYLY
ncbi:hypothetical protein RG959_22255 [Domibacillus sp. 8LH]|uniref:hypothetical protein n=1 Tax=Domibacillus sp. 8LH TaxID=3073900 RepID=UPI003178794D